MASTRCHACGRPYRAGHYATHLTSEAHRQGAERRTRNRVVSRSPKRDAKRAAWARARRVADYSDRVIVKRHKRSRPNDGRERVVGVVRYIRDRPAPTTAEWRDVGGARRRVKSRMVGGTWRPVAILINGAWRAL